MFNSRILYIALSLVATAMVTSCVSDDASESGPSGDAYINLRIASRVSSARRAPAHNQTTATKQENNLHKLQVWSFNSTDAEGSDLPLSYREETFTGDVDSYTMSMPVPVKTGGKPLTDIDLYVFANGGSGASLEASKLLTRSQIESSTITGLYGINTGSDPAVPQTTAVPDKGLPMSRLVKGININEYKTDAPSTSSKAISVPLLRGVSKVNFYFARKAGEKTAACNVTRIVFDTNIYPTVTSLFPEACSPTEIETAGLHGTEFSGYQESTMQLGAVANGSIAPVEDPVSLTKDADEAADDYKNRLTAAGVSTVQTAYMQETDKPITGTIYYKPDATSTVERNCEFSLDEGSGYRNHEILVYAYFSEDNDLKLKYSVIPWAQDDINVNTSDQNYLRVYPQEAVMRNVDTHEDINFFSSEDCKVEVTEAYYHNADGVKTNISPNSAQYPKATIDKGRMGKLHINSAVPTNLTVKYFTVKVSLPGDKKVREVTVRQYPLEFILSTVTGWYSTRTTSGWIDWQDHQTEHPNWKQSSDDDGLFDAKVFITDDGEDYIYYYYDDGGGFFDNIPPFQAKLNGVLGSGQKNNHMYVVQITETDPAYTIGHATHIDKTTHLSDENVVSPAFMIASQLGAVGKYTGDNGERPAEHCATYKEVGTDSTAYTGWRLPTEQEIGVIVKYQQNKDQDAMAPVLLGSSYWALSGTKVKTGYENQGDGYIRCVRDLSPAEVKKIEEAGKK